MSYVILKSGGNMTQYPDLMEILLKFIEAVDWYSDAQDKLEPSHMNGLWKRYRSKEPITW